MWQSLNYKRSSVKTSLTTKKTKKSCLAFLPNSYWWSTDRFFFKYDKFNHFSLSPVPSSKILTELTSPNEAIIPLNEVDLGYYGKPWFFCRRCFCNLNLFKQKLLLNRIEKSKISLQPHTFIMYSSWDGSCRMHNECVELYGNLTNKKWCLNSPSSLIHATYR